MEREEWRRVDSNPTYWVSNRGRMKHKNKILHGHLSHVTRQRTVSLRNSEGYKQIYIGRLILLAFVGPPPEKCSAQQVDGDPDNLRLDNLFWGPRKPPLKHKPTDKESRAILRLFRQGETRIAIAKKLDLTYNVVSHHLRKAKLIP